MKPQQVVYIYPDIAFAVSLIMNGLILWGTARFSHRETRWLGIVGGATAGAAYSFAAAFPEWQYLHTFWLKLLFSFLMVGITFAPLNFKSFINLTLVFYGTSFFLGGLFFGILYFINSSPYYYHLYDLSVLIASYFIPGLIISLLLFVLWSRYIKKIIQKQAVQNIFMIPIKVRFDGNEIVVNALLDTGNSLEDPISRFPVVIIEYSAIKEIFSGEIQKALERSNDNDYMAVFDSVSGTKWSTRFRIIPFTSVGRENGLLLGFRPDQLKILNTGDEILTSDVIVGIYRQELSPERRYRALLHPDLLQLNTA